MSGINNIYKSKALLLLIVLISGCAASNSRNNTQQHITEMSRGDNTFLNEGGEISIKNTKIILKFDKVVSDSRCPKGKQCIWQGVASIQLSLNGNHEHHTFKLDTLSASNFKNSKYISNYKITLQDLTVAGKNGQYIANLKIE